MNKLNTVSHIKPPITTVANGLEVSEPIPVDIAAGRRPIAAIIAVMITGRILDSTPNLNASIKVHSG